MGDFIPLTQEQENRYENARNLLGALVSLRAAWIGEEREKSEPDQGKIDLWLMEKRSYSTQSMQLDPYDDGEIQHVLNEHAIPVAEEIARFKANLSAKEK